LDVSATEISSEKVQQQEQSGALEQKHEKSNGRKQAEDQHGGPVDWEHAIFLPGFFVARLIVHAAQLICCSREA
jgi:hypothetical protein